MIPTTHHLITRTSNKDRHPGLPDVKAYLRSQADIAEEWHLAKAAKENSRVKSKNLVSKVTGLEDWMQLTYTSSMVNAANLGLSAIQKVTRKPAAIASSTVINEVVNKVTSNGKQCLPVSEFLDLEVINIDIEGGTGASTSSKNLQVEPSNIPRKK